MCADPCKKCEWCVQGSHNSHIQFKSRQKMARFKAGSPYALKWEAMIADVRAQNPDKSDAEIRQIVLAIQGEFSKNWQTYKYVK